MFDELRILFSILIYTCHLILFFCQSNWLTTNLCVPKLSTCRLPNASLTWITKGNLLGTIHKLLIISCFTELILDDIGMTRSELVNKAAGITLHVYIYLFQKGPFTYTDFRVWCWKPVPDTYALIWKDDNWKGKT